jgi:hypothetical protein
MIFKDAFIYVSEPIQIGHDFIKHNLKTGVLYVHESKRINYRTDDSGDIMVALIGEKFNASKNALEIDRIESLKDAEEALYNWTGRFVLYAHGSFFHDACGLHHVYYGEVDNKTIITSSIALVNELFTLCPHDDMGELNLNHPMDWLPLPLTKYKELRGLLPFQEVNTSLSVWFRKIFHPISAHSKSDLERVFNEFIQTGRYIASKVVQDGRPIELSLTGGHDSRTALAFFKEKGNNISLSLFDFSKIAIWDMMAFFRLTRKFHLSSRYYSRILKRKNKLNLIRFRKGIDDMCVVEDDLFYAHGQLNREKKTIILRSNVPTTMFRHKLINQFERTVSSPSGLVQVLEQQYTELDSVKIKSLNDWYITRRNEDKVNNTVDWRILFWLDQRSCAWAGTIDGATAISDCVYINPFNCPKVLQQFYQIYTLLDSGKDFQEEIMKRLDPELLQIPFNKKDGTIIYNRFLREALRFIWRIRLSYFNL